jgi:hypothetical protein
MRYVAIRVPKNMQSEPRNAHINSFRLFKPVDVAACSSAWVIAVALAK